MQMSYSLSDSKGNGVMVDRTLMFNVTHGPNVTGVDLIDKQPSMIALILTSNVGYMVSAALGMTI